MKNTRFMDVLDPWDSNVLEELQRTPQILLTCREVKTFCQSRSIFHGHRGA
jgi:hypothetical protein